jgi:EAL domain-containing protein (putative c-di-GMP-specific phosphodiesterase class I)/response regulator of citrate/malate metabolism
MVNKEIIKKAAKLKVLYVEDEEDLQKETKGLFDDIFLQVDCAKDGKEALDIYLQNSTDYDLIITDLNMPKMNGIELIKEIKKINETQVIIVISAHNESEYFLQSIHSGINGYVLKPFDFEGFFFTLDKCIQDIDKTSQIPKDDQEQTKPLSKLDLSQRLQELSSTNTLCSAFFLGIDNYLHIHHLLGFQQSELLGQNITNKLTLCKPKGASLYEYDLDKFVLLFETPLKQQAEQYATYLLAFFKETPILELDDISIYASFSIGITLDAKPNQCIAQAKISFVELQNLEAKNAYNIYKDTPITQNDSTIWIDAVRQSLEKDLLIPYFQPIIHSSSCTIVAYEVLARIQHNQQIILPELFLDAIKHSGLNRNLTRAIVGKSFEKFRQSDMPFHINVTSDDLLDTNFLDFLLIKCNNCNIKPKSVVLEILQNSCIQSNNTPKIIDNIKQIRSKGFRFALDHFDIHQPINHEKIILFDLVKINCANALNNETDMQTLIDSIEKLHSLGIATLAEHISTAQQYDKIKDLGFEYMQGNYFYPVSK